MILNSIRMYNVKFKDEFGVDVMSDPSMLAKPEYAAMSALFWFKKNDKKVKKLSNGDWSNTEGVTRAVNGGLNGLQDRIDRTHKAMDILGA